MADRKILLTGKWLTANHISAANRLLKKMFPSQSGLQDSHYLSVKRDWNDDATDFVQIIYIDPGHWACLSNKCSGTNIDLFDSMHTVPVEEGTIVRQACCIMKHLNHTSPSITINVIGVQPQYGGSDCGLFAISMALDLCLGLDPFKQKVVQDSMREHLLFCFEEQKMSPFPKVTRKGLEKMTRIVTSVTFGIYCICRGIENMPMVMCDWCNEWFHPSCLPVKIPTKFFTNKSLPWKCPSCKCKYEYLQCI